MNPSFKVILVFTISLEISLKASLITNLSIILAAFGFLLLKKMSLKQLSLLLLSALLPAFTIFATLNWFTPNPQPYFAWVLSSRVYVYLLSLTCLAKTTSAVAFARSLEQNFKFPTKFTYGVLAALNLFPQMQIAVKKIHINAMMRHTKIRIWSPFLYLKAILVALKAANNLAQAMQSHAYVEDQKRSHIVVIKIGVLDYLYLAGGLLIFNLILFYCN